VHDPHHALATPARTLLACLAEVALKRKMLSTFEKAVGKMGFPPRISCNDSRGVFDVVIYLVTRFSGPVASVSSNLKTGKTFDLFLDEENVKKLLAALVFSLGSTKQEEKWLKVLLILHRRARLVLNTRTFKAFEVLKKTFVMTTLAYNAVFVALFNKLTPSMHILAEQAIAMMHECVVSCVCSL
jgi:hypothetical protein